jgi:hypothetical protein
MANYKNIKGFSIQYLDSDPPNPIEGQIWFNSTSGTFKGTEVGGVPAGTWASGGSLNTARNSMGGAGTQTSAIAAGGRTPATLVVGNVELYDGSSWTETTDLNTARRQSRATATVNTAAIVYSGPSDLGPPYEANSGSVELWNGSSWTETTEMNTPRGNAANGNMGTSSTDAFLVGGFGGFPPPPATRANAEIWNGTSWTEVNDLNTGRYDLGGFGTTTSSLVFGGVDTGNTAATESYNGTSWTEVADLATACSKVVGAGQSNTSGIRFMGENPSTVLATTEFWNGTSWTEVNDLTTARNNGAGAGSTTSALAFGGYTGTAYTGVTEEWNAPPISIKTFTTS